MAANLREAFKEQDYLRTAQNKAMLHVCTPVVLIPEEDYEDTEEYDAETIYASVLTGHKGEEKVIDKIPELDAYALYSVNRDLKMVVSDNFTDVIVENVMVPVWVNLYKRFYQAGQKRKLFAYFHDKKVDICNFEQRRLHFANSFDAQHAHDALYYLLFVWKQLGMNQKEDDLFVLGDIPHKEWLMNRMNAYLKNVHTINPSVILNRSALSEIEGMPFDLML